MWQPSTACPYIPFLDNHITYQHPQYSSNMKNSNSQAYQPPQVIRDCLTLQHTHIQSHFYLCASRVGSINLHLTAQCGVSALNRQDQALTAVLVYPCYIMINIIPFPTLKSIIANQTRCMHLDLISKLPSWLVFQHQPFYPTYIL